MFLVSFFPIMIIFFLDVDMQVVFSIEIKYFSAFLHPITPVKNGSDKIRLDQSSITLNSLSKIFSFIDCILFIKNNSKIA